MRERKKFRRYLERRKKKREKKPLYLIEIMKMHRLWGEEKREKKKFDARHLGMIREKRELFLAVSAGEREETPIDAEEVETPDQTLQRKECGLPSMKKRKKKKSSFY